MGAQAENRQLRQCRLLATASPAGHVPRPAEATGAFRARADPPPAWALQLTCLQMVTSSHRTCRTPLRLRQPATICRRERAPDSPQVIPRVDFAPGQSRCAAASGVVQHRASAGFGDRYPEPGVVHCAVPAVRSPFEVRGLTARRRTWSGGGERNGVLQRPDPRQRGSHCRGTARSMRPRVPSAAPMALRPAGDSVRLLRARCGRRRASTVRCSRPRQWTVDVIAAPAGAAGEGHARRRGARAGGGAAQRSGREPAGAGSSIR